MIAIKINVKRIDKAHLYAGEKGTYLDAVLHDKPDTYGNAGFVSQSVSKEARAKGVKGPIIGNWKHLGQRSDTNDAKPLPPADDCPAY